MPPQRSAIYVITTTSDWMTGSLLLVIVLVTPHSFLQIKHVVGYIAIRYTALNGWSLLWGWSLLSVRYEFFLYRVSQKECARLLEGVPYVKVYRYNPKHLCPKLSGYEDKGARKVWSSCGSTYCTWFAWRNTHTLRIVRSCLQPAQARFSLRLHM